MIHEIDGHGPEAERFGDDVLSTDQQRRSGISKLHL